MQIKDLLSFSQKKLNDFSFASATQAKQYNSKNPTEIIIGFGKTMKSQREYLQSLLADKLYQHYRVVRMTDKAKRIINDLFTVYAITPEQ